MKKKLLAFALAASMVVTLAPAAPVDTVKAADATASVDYIAQGNSYVNPFLGRDLSKGVEMSFKVTRTAGTTASLFATLIAFHGKTDDEGKLFFNEASNFGFNAWKNDEYFDANKNGDLVVQDYLGEGTSTVKITIDETGFTVSVNGKEVYDESILTDASKCATGAGFSAANTYSNMLNFLSTVTTLDFGTGSPWTGVPNASITDFVAKTDGEELDFDMIEKVERKRSYAQLPSFEGTDFTNGITMTADVNLKGWGSNTTADWTSIFMIGDGTVGGEGADASIIYHFSQGLASAGGWSDTVGKVDAHSIGYYGNGSAVLSMGGDGAAPITSPFMWDYLKSNMNVWNNFTAVISPTEMSTYANGERIQTLSGDFSAYLKAFSKAKGNYLGASYWSGDIDFQGDLDNVAIYNKALTAEQIKAMAANTSLNASAAGSDLSKVGETPLCSYDFSTGAGDLVLQEGCTAANGVLSFGAADGDTPIQARPSMRIMDITAEANTKKIEVLSNENGCTVKVKVGNAAYKNAKVTGAEGVFTTSKVLTPGTKIRARIEKAGYATTWQDYTVTKLGLSVSGIKVKAGKVTGKVNTTGATVKVKVGKAAYKKAKVSGKNFTFTSKNIVAGKKAVIKIQVSHKYAKKTITKSKTVKKVSK